MSTILYSTVQRVEKGVWSNTVARALLKSGLPITRRYSQKSLAACVVNAANVL